MLFNKMQKNGEMNSTSKRREELACECGPIRDAWCSQHEECRLSATEHGCWGSIGPGVPVHRKITKCVSLGSNPVKPLGETHA